MIKQVAQTECGLCCCLMILRYYKSKESVKSLQDDVDIGRDGLSFKRMKEILKSRGMDTAAYMVEDVTALEKFNGPFVAFWDNMHYVVVER